MRLIWEQWGIEGCQKPRLGTGGTKQAVGTFYALMKIGFSNRRILNDLPFGTVLSPMQFGRFS